MLTICKFKFNRLSSKKLNLSQAQIARILAKIKKYERGKLMKSGEFEEVIDYILIKCRNLLNSKATEYATEDRLHNFKVAAELQGVDPKQALAGMMAKHTVSVYDMCMCGNAHKSSLWDEKICDSINYPLLLRALVAEQDWVWEGQDIDEKRTEADILS